MITLFIQGLTDGPVWTYLFRLKFHTLGETIRVAEQDNFGVKRDHVNSNSYRPFMRQESGAQNRWTSVTLRVKALALPIIINCRYAIGVKSQGIMQMNAVPRPRYPVPQETVTINRPRRVRGVGPTLSLKRNIATNDQKMTRVSRCGAPY